jgi:hypothetical protein
MLCPRVALPTSFMRTLKLLVEAFPAPPPLPAGACAVAIVGAIVPFASVASAPSRRLGTVRRCRCWRLSRANARLHLFGELRLDLAQLRRMPCMHGEDLRRHDGCKGGGMSHVALGRTGARLGYKWRLCSRGGGEARVSVAGVGVSQEVGRRFGGGRACFLKSHFRQVVSARKGKAKLGG